MKKMLIFSLFAMQLVHAQKCSNFATQEEAQKFHDENNATYLDRDKDGEACECLPGGSKHGDPVCDRQE